MYMLSSYQHFISKESYFLSLITNSCGYGSKLTQLYKLAGIIDVIHLLSVYSMGLSIIDYSSQKQRLFECIIEHCILRLQQSRCFYNHTYSNFSHYHMNFITIIYLPTHTAYMVSCLPQIQEVVSSRWSGNNKDKTQQSQFICQGVSVTTRWLRVSIMCQNGMICLPAGCCPCLLPQ